jgi:hypothetical protein
LRSLAGRTLSACYGLEMVFNLLSGDAPDRYLLVDGRRPEDDAPASYGSHPDASSFSLVDAWEGVRIDLKTDRAAHWIHAPVETVSSSEAGAERIYQGTIVIPVWEVNLEPNGGFGVDLTVSLRHGPEIKEGHHP